MSAVAFDEEVSAVEARGEALSGKLLAGKKALVTGGSRGIGKAAALLLAEAGAAVAVNYQHSADAADNVCRTARKLGVEARAVQSRHCPRRRSRRHV